MTENNHQPQAAKSMCLHLAGAIGDTTLDHFEQFDQLLIEENEPGVISIMLWSAGRTKGAIVLTAAAAADLGIALLEISRAGPPS